MAKLPENSRFKTYRTQPEHFSKIHELCRAVYPSSPCWSDEQLQSHCDTFPEGQFTVIEKATQRVVGIAASLIVFWDDYGSEEPWRKFTDHGMFTNHDPVQGKTLYGAEVMVHPKIQGQGVGKLLYKARRDLATGMNLLRIRAGARLRGYSKYADAMTPHEYTKAVVNQTIQDPTLTFQLKQGFVVLDVVSEYLRSDPESLGFAALIEWLNPAVASPEHVQKQASTVREFLS